MAEELPSGSHKVCPRCGAAAGADIWCESCGLNLKQHGDLPSADAYAARVREQRWLETEREDQRQARKQQREHATSERHERARRRAERREQERLERRRRWDQRWRRARRPLKIATLTLLGLLLVGIGAASAWHFTGWDAPLVGMSPLRDDEPTEVVAAEEEAEEAPDPERFRGWLGSHSPVHKTRTNAPGGIPTFVFRDREEGTGTYTLILEGPHGLSRTYQNRRHSGGFDEVRSEWLHREVHEVVGDDYGTNQVLQWRAIWTVDDEVVARWAFRTVPETETGDLDVPTSSCPPVPGGAMGGLDLIELEASGVECEEAQDVAVEASQALEAGRPPGRFRPHVTVRGFECVLGPMTIGYPVECHHADGATISFRPD